jgi:serine phosphatase RsbU (regulator of sigma subunit)
MEDPGELSERFGHLNRSLVRSLGERRYVCFTMAEIDVVSGELRLASCGCPYPLHYRADDDSIRELQVDAYPLGVRADTTYDVIEAQLAAGDYLILYSDGIPETVDRDDGMFGFEATASAVLDACRRQATAEELIERVMAAARVFAGRARQEDDMTCVVVRVTST